MHLTLLLCLVVCAEARGGLHIVEQSLWSSLPKLLRRMSSEAARGAAWFTASCCCALAARVYWAGPCCLAAMGVSTPAACWAVGMAGTNQQLF